MAAQDVARIVGMAFMVGLAGSPAHADHVPQICYDGQSLLLDQHAYEEAVRAYSRCIETGVLDSENLAISYFNRGLGRYAIQDLEGAIDDLDRSIELRPGYADAYCVRGTAYLELTLGSVGYDDIDKGRAMGARDDYWCEYD